MIVALAKGKEAVNNNMKIEDIHAIWLSKKENTSYLEVRWLEPQTAEDCLRWGENPWAFYITTIASEGEGRRMRTPVGTIKADVDINNMSASIGFMIDIDHRRNGLASQAVALMMAELAIAGYVYVWAGCHRSNDASRAVLRKNEFKIVGDHPQKLIGPDGREDHILYGRML